MLAIEWLWISRMREIRTSGLMRAKVMAMPGLRYSTGKKHHSSVAEGVGDHFELDFAD
jgi:hypothetical protein